MYVFICKVKTISYHLLAREDITALVAVEPAHLPVLHVIVLH